VAKRETERIWEGESKVPIFLRQLVGWNAISTFFERMPSMACRFSQEIVPWVHWNFPFIPGDYDG
jgi:hypothetical protein